MKPELKSFLTDLGTSLVMAAAAEAQELLESIDIRNPDKAREAVRGIVSGIVEGAKTVTGNVPFDAPKEPPKP